MVGVRRRTHAVSCPGSGSVQTASTGSLGFNNGGDTVTLSDGATDQAVVAYGSEAGNNQSLTLDPDIFGSFAQHTSATGSGGALFSPGTEVDGGSFIGCPVAGLVINEIHADPAADLPGDANGDGVRSFTDDEFVEIVNNSSIDVNISGWTLSDAVQVRHTFPAGTVVPAGCAVTVFGGETPTGDFGGSVVQTASAGSLGLNNGGDTVTLASGTEIVAQTMYGSEGGDNQSLTLDPDVTGSAYVKHSTAASSSGALFSPGTRIDGSRFAGCGAIVEVFEIFEIQGSGLASPIEGAQRFRTY